jgi:hypothetical protein
MTQDNAWKFDYDRKLQTAISLRPSSVRFCARLPCGVSHPLKETNSPVNHTLRGQPVNAEHIGGCRTAGSLRARPNRKEEHSRIQTERRPGPCPPARRSTFSSDCRGLRGNFKVRNPVPDEDSALAGTGRGMLSRQEAKRFPRTCEYKTLRIRGAGD